MFYADFLFVKRGALSKVWQCAHLSKKLTRRDVRETDVRQAVRDIEQPSAPLALRLQGQLLLGVVRVYDGQVRYLQQDCTEASTRLSSLMDRKAGQGRSGAHPTEADPSQLVAPAGAITVSEREQLGDGYDALEEQRYLEDHALRLSSSSQADPFPSLSLSLSSQQLTPLTQSQSAARLSQQARPSDISLEQARRSQLSLNLDDFELGEGMALDDDAAMDLGAGAGEGGMEDAGGDELEVMRDEGMEMGRVSMQQDGAALEDDDARRESLISMPGDVSADPAQLAADSELSRRREERRMQRKRLRFAGEVRDAVIEKSADEIKSALLDDSDIVRSRGQETTIVNPRRWLLNERLSSLLGHSSIMGRVGDAQMDALMEELFSPASMRLPGAADESKEAKAAEAAGDGLEILVGGEFDVGMGMEDDEGGGVPSTPPPSSPREPRSPSTVAGSAVPPTLPPPSRSDLEATAAVDEAASSSLHSFFNEPATDTAATHTTDSSTLTSRTVKTLALLSTHYTRSPNTPVSFTQLTAGRVGRGVAAGLFYQMLVLGQAGAVRCVQEEAYGEINVARGDRFEEVSMRLGGEPVVSQRAGRRVAAR